MTATAAPTVVADTTNIARPEWLELRRRGIGGSDAAAICGQSRWTSPFEVWLDKVGMLDDSDHASEAAEWGTILEPVVRTQVAARTGHRIDEVHQMLAHPARPWQLVNLDGEIADLDAVYEGKTASAYLADDWADDKVPDAYVLQGQHALAVTGRARVIYGVLIGGQRLEIRTVERDDELIDHLVTLEAEFWDMVEARTPPPPDGSKACTDLLAHLWDVTPGAVRTLDADGVAHVEALIGQRREAVEMEALYTEAKADIENQLKVLVGDHEVLAAPSGEALFTWKEQTRTTIDTNQLERDLPDIAERYRRTSTHRRVHFPKRKRVA